MAGRVLRPHILCEGPVSGAFAAMAPEGRWRVSSTPNPYPLYPSC